MPDSQERPVKMPYQIRISVTANTKQEAIEFLQRKMKWAEEGGWQDTAEAGGGSDGPSFSVERYYVPLNT